ncbi:deoxyribonuclease IV [Streptomyces sp. NPDC012888]|uniref:deoxyribonuclease IV n=1 Tax=Streptomyces sp. NPDC012888 TaxID=3364855 RepID=UPI00368D2923
MRNPVGGHVPVAGGLARVGLAYARKMGAEAVQVFVANPRGWATPAGNPAQDELFREGCAAAGIPAYVHAPYLINFGSHNAATVERSVESLRHSLRRGREIGALGVVVHTGSATGGRPRAEALAQVGRYLLPLLDELTHDDDPLLLLESTAGQGSSLCSRTWDFGPYFEVLESHPKLGVCLDTCHVHAAGHDLAGPGGVKETLDLLVETVGPGRLKLVHANDSKEAAGAHKDRHANIGAGHIGRDAFAELLTHAETAGVPLIIETPGGEEGHAADVALLKSLR